MESYPFSTCMLSCPRQVCFHVLYLFFSIADALSMTCVSHPLAQSPWAKARQRGLQVQIIYVAPVVIHAIFTISFVASESSLASVIAVHTITHWKNLCTSILFLCQQSIWLSVCLKVCCQNTVNLAYSSTSGTQGYGSFSFVINTGRSRTWLQTAMGH